MVKSRSDRGRRIGAIPRSHRVSGLISARGEIKGMGFTHTVKDADGNEGYKVYATIGTSLSERDVVDAYRARDIIEKAIRMLKSCPGLCPVYLSTKCKCRSRIYQFRLIVAIGGCFLFILCEHCRIFFASSSDFFETVEKRFGMFEVDRTPPARTLQKLNHYQR